MVFSTKSLFIKAIHFVLVILLAVSPVQAQAVLSSNIVSQVSFASVQPLMLKGVMIDGQDPMNFSFVVTGAGEPVNNSKELSADEDLQKETRRLAEYFLTSVAIADSDLWVNLSPVEPDRIIPGVFGQTEMGKILLEQDAVLKQLTSELMNPESETGKKLWDKVYDVGMQRAVSLQNNDVGFARDTIESFNKVWIVPGESVIVQDGARAFIKSSRLNVMLEEEYQSREHLAAKQALDFSSGSSDSDIKSLIKQIIIPVIEEEVNSGARFAPLRQVFHSHLLAVWYKNHLHESLLNRVYADQQKINGIAIDPSFKEQVYQQYLQKFKNGAFDVIKEDYDPQAQELVARKYFSGGVILANQTSLHIETAAPGTFAPAMLVEADGAMVVPVDMRELSASNAMLTTLDPNKSYGGIVKKTNQRVIVAPKRKADEFVANLLWDVQRSNYENGKLPFIPELATGSTPEGIYALWQEKMLEFLKINPDLLETFKSFNMDEYALGTDYYDYMERNLFGKLRQYLSLEKTRLLNGYAQDPQTEVLNYELEIDAALQHAEAKGAMTIGIGGVGVEGHVAFNEAVFKMLIKSLRRTNFRIVKRLRENNYFYIDDYENIESLKQAMREAARIRRDERRDSKYKFRMIQKIRKNRKDKSRTGEFSYGNQAYDRLWDQMKQQPLTFYVKGLEQHQGWEAELKAHAKTLEIENELEFSVDIFDKKIITEYPSRRIYLSSSTITENSAHSSSVADIKTEAYTMGMGTLKKWNFFIAVAYGVKKNPIMKRILNRESSPEVPLGQLLAEHTNTLVVLDHAAAKDVEFDGEPGELDLNKMDMHNLQAAFTEMNNAMRIKEIYIKPKSYGMIWRRKNFPAKIGSLNIQDFPSEAKVLLIEFKRGDLETYMQGHMAILKETFPDKKWNKHVKRIRLHKNLQGKTIGLKNISFADILKFKPDIVFAPSMDRDPVLRQMLELLATQKSGGMGVEEYERESDRFFPETSDRILLSSLDSAEDLKHHIIPVRPNLFVFVKKETADLSAELSLNYATQVARTPYQEMISIKQLLMANVAKFLGMSPPQSDGEDLYADAGVILEYDFEKQELVYRPGAYRVTYEATNDRDDPYKIVLNKRSLISHQSPHSDDISVNTGASNIVDLFNAIPTAEMIQDLSGVAAGVSDYDEGSRLRWEENIRYYDALFKAVGYRVEIQESKNDVTGLLRAVITAFDNEKSIKAQVTVDTLGAVYGINAVDKKQLTAESSRNMTEEAVVNMIATLLKEQINAVWEANDHQSLTTWLLKSPHRDDLHSRHAQMFFRTMQAVLFEIRNDQEFNLRVKVERVLFWLYLSTWAGNGKFYAHYTPDDSAEKSSLETIIVGLRDLLLARASSELSSPEPGGKTYDNLGGPASSRTKPSGILAPNVSPEVAIARWGHFKRDYGKRGADWLLVTALMGSLKRSTMNDIMVIAATPKDVKFLKHIEDVRLIAADVNASRLEEVANKGVKGVQLVSKADLSVGPRVMAIIDFNQFAASLPPLATQHLSQDMTLRRYLDSIYDRKEEEDAVLLVSGKIATNDPAEKEFMILSRPDDVGNQSYYFYNEDKIAPLFGQQEKAFELFIPNGLLDNLNGLKDGNNYRAKSTRWGDFIIRTGIKKPIWIAFARKVLPKSMKLRKKKEAVFAGADSDRGSLVSTPGGIDLGYGKNIRMEKSFAADDIQDSGDIIRMRQNLKGIVPVPLGPAVPLKDFLRSK